MITIEKDQVVIRLPISETLSSTGKNTLIATTRGNVQTSTQYKGKNVTLSVNAYVPVK